MDWDFAKEVDELRDHVGFPLILSSAWRCPEHPTEKKKEKPGAHVTGRAVDIAVTGEQAIEVLRHALAMGFDRIGVQQKGSGRFIHLDKAIGFPSPAIWSY
jgi:zinc D-Ala-D-Ala carboxypeptidase